MTHAAVSLFTSQCKHMGTFTNRAISICAVHSYLRPHSYWERVSGAWNIHKLPRSYKWCYVRRTLWIGAGFPRVWCIKLALKTLNPDQNCSHFSFYISIHIFGMKINVFWLISLKHISKDLITITHVWFRQYLGTQQPISHCLHQWKYSYQFGNMRQSGTIFYIKIAL